MPTMIRLLGLDTTKKTGVKSVSSVEGKVETLQRGVERGGREEENGEFGRKGGANEKEDRMTVPDTPPLIIK